MTPKRYIIPLFVPHLGCPHDCVFCSQRKISGTAAPVTAGDVLKAAEAAREKFPEGVKPELAFYGGSFTAIPDDLRLSLLEAAYSYVKSGFLSSLRVSTRPDAVNCDALTQLWDYGVRTIELGAQSMDGAVLKLSGRGHTVLDTVLSSGLVRERGFELILQMMTGLPGDTAEKTRNTARELVSLKPDGVRIYPAVVIRGTRLYEMWKSGEYNEHSLEDAVSLCAEVYEIFEEAKIPVIRMGLNPSEDLACGDAAAGAYHAAFGELVYSEIMLKRARLLLGKRTLQRETVLYVNPSSISLMVGQKRRNIEMLSEEFGIKVRVKPAGEQINRLGVGMA